MLLPFSHVPHYPAIPYCTIFPFLARFEWIDIALDFFLHFQDEQLKEVHNMIEMEEEGCDVKFKSLFEQVQAGNKPIIAVLMIHSLYLINQFCYLFSKIS